MNQPEKGLTEPKQEENIITHYQGLWENARGEFLYGNKKGIATRLYTEADLKEAARKAWDVSADNSRVYFEKQGLTMTSAGSFESYWAERNK